MVEFKPIQTNAMPIGDKLKNMVWKLVNRTLYRFTPPILTIFRKWRVLLVRIFGGKVSWSASLHPSSVIDYPWNLKMGSRASLGEHCWVYAMAPVEIGEQTCIGKDVSILTGSHDISSCLFSLVVRPILIGDGCWVATSSIVLPGVSIGNFSVVAAGSVVAKDVEPWTVVGGNPARFIKKRVLRDA